jgi:hypothetical protein
MEIPSRDTKINTVDFAVFNTVEFNARSTRPCILNFKKNRKNGSIYFCSGYFNSPLPSPASSPPRSPSSYPLSPPPSSPPPVLYTTNGIGFAKVTVATIISSLQMPLIQIAALEAVTIPIVIAVVFAVAAAVVAVIAAAVVVVYRLSSSSLLS